MLWLLWLALCIPPLLDASPSCSPYYVRWPRVRLNFQPVASSRLPLRACKSACSLGEDPQVPGRGLECAALNHHPSPDGFSHHCDVFQPHQLQNIDGYVEADDRYSFYWKYCLNSSRRCSGDYAFTYLSDRFMDSAEVVRVSRRASLEECLSECLEESSFPCRSISFNRTDGGCHLSTDSQLTKPNAVRLNNNPNFRIDYYENNCYNLSETFRFEHTCREDGVVVKVHSKVPYTGALYGLYDFFSCRIEPKRLTDFELFFPSPTVNKNCSDSIRLKGDEMILEVVLSTDGVEPLYFITPDDLTYQAKCPLPKKMQKGTTKETEKMAKNTQAEALEASTHALFSMLAKEQPIPTTKSTTHSTTTKTPTTTTRATTTVKATTSTTTTTTTTAPATTTTKHTTTTSTTQKPTTTTTTNKPTTVPSTTTTTTTPRPTTTTTKQTTTAAVKTIPPAIHRAPVSDGTPTRSVKTPITFDIYKDGRPVDAVVVGSKITLAFTPHYPIPPEFMSVLGCQVEPIDPKYDWEKEPLPIIREACPADLVGLVCPPKRSEYGIKVTVESFRYQTTPQIQYSCLIRVCPFAPCPVAQCQSVEGCPSDERMRRGLSLEQIREALEQDPNLARQFGISPSLLARPAHTVEQQLVALGGDHVVKRRLVVVNSQDQLRYYMNTGGLL